MVLKDICWCLLLVSPLAESFLVLMILAAYSWPVQSLTQRRTTEKAPLGNKERGQRVEMGQQHCQYQANFIWMPDRHKSGLSGEVRSKMWWHFIQYDALSRSVDQLKEEKPFHTLECCLIPDKSLTYTVKSNRLKQRPMWPHFTLQCCTVYWIRNRSQSEQFFSMTTSATWVAAKLRSIGGGQFQR